MCLTDTGIMGLNSVADNVLVHWLSSHKLSLLGAEILSDRTRHVQLIVLLSLTPFVLQAVPIQQQ